MAKKKVSPYREIALTPLWLKPEAIRFRLHDATLVAGGTGVGSVALQFKVSAYKDEDLLWSSIGWRAMKGKVYPPSRRLSNGAFVPIVQMGQHLEASLMVTLKEWWVDIPEVRFPGQALLLRPDREYTNNLDIGTKAI